MTIRDELKEMIDHLPEERLDTVRCVLGLFVQPEKAADQVAGPIFAHAVAVFDGNREKAACWLTTPHRLLGGACPTDLLNTVEGAKRVQEILHRIEHGIYS